MDALFANCQGLTDKSCAQVFYGITSHMMNVYGMRSKVKVPVIYKDFIWEEGIPSVLQRDGAKEQSSKKMSTIKRCQRSIVTTWFVIPSQSLIPHSKIRLKPAPYDG
jgi:hypothetical protein